jgi:integrase
MASIEKRGKGYRVRWRDPDGTSRGRKCPNKNTAIRLSRDVEEAGAEGRRWEPRDACAEPELDALMRAYILECARVHRPKTAVAYARYLEVFHRWLRKKFGAGRRLFPSLLSKHLLGEFYDELGKGGQNGKKRALSTRRKIVEGVQLFWRWAYDDEDFGEFVPRPRKLRMARQDGTPTVAPTWAEVDACIRHTKAWQQRLAILLRFTGLRVSQAMHLRWEDFDLDKATLRIRGALGKSAQERRGRIIPISPHLVEELSSWGMREGWVISSSRDRTVPHTREARARDMRRAWKRAGIRPEAWENRPHHSFRKCFVSELKRSRADSDAVEFLIGHSLSLRGVYTDPSALPLREAVDLIPPLGAGSKVIQLVGA